MDQGSGELREEGSGETGLGTASSAVRAVFVNMRIWASVVAVLFLLVCSLVLGFAQGWLPSTPSSLLKLLPKPEFEKTTITGKKENGRVIDLQGGEWNGGKLTELVICSEPTPQGWEVPEGITIRNGRLRGSIRIFGLGVNGEAPRVRQSSHQDGHTEQIGRAHV